MLFSAAQSLALFRWPAGVWPVTSTANDTVSSVSLPLTWRRRQFADRRFKFSWLNLFTLLTSLVFFCGLSASICIERWMDWSATPFTRRVMLPFTGTLFASNDLFWRMKVNFDVTEAESCCVANVVHCHSKKRLPNIFHNNLTFEIYVRKHAFWFIFQKF